MATIHQAIQSYRKLREMRDALKKKHSEELKPLTEKMFLVENYLLLQLNNQGVESMKTDVGTAYKSTTTKAKIIDWDVALAYIKKNELFHMLEKRISKVAVEEFIEAQGSPPPGVDITQEVKVNVRK